MGDPRDNLHEQRKRRRLPVAVRAKLVLKKPDGTVRYEVKDAMIWNLSYAGLGLSLSVEAAARDEDLSSYFEHGRICEISGTIPGCTEPSRFQGKIIWVSPAVSPDTETRVGCSLEGNAEEELADLRTFVEKREREEDDRAQE